jgi:6-phosphogluconolactonase
VSGAEKANALREVLEGDYRPECFPAQIIRPITGKTLWLADRESAQLLKQNLS